MVKKSSGWNLQDMQDTLVKDTEQKISDGFEEIKQEQTKAPDASPSGSLEPVREITATRKFHKERTQDILVHCPVSLHRRLTELKNHRWDEYGERVTINNMIVEAIADWLDRKDI